jgi:hypothetical protein
VLTTLERLSSLLATKYKRKRWLDLAWLDNDNDDDDDEKFLSMGN